MNNERYDPFRIPKAVYNLITCFYFSRIDGPVSCEDFPYVAPGYILHQNPNVNPRLCCREQGDEMIHIIFIAFILLSY